MNALQIIPGIGEKTARRLVEHFGSEEAALAVFSHHDIAAIASIDGIGEKNAVALMQGFIFKGENISPDDFLKTKEGWRIYRSVLDIIRSYTSTAYARDKLNIYFPMPSSKKDKIISVMSDVADACKLVNKITVRDGEIDRLVNALKGIEQIKKVTPKKIRERVIIAAKHEEYQMASSRYSNMMDVILAQSSRELIDATASYHHVTASIKLENVDIPFEANIEYMDLSKLEIWYTLPEQEIAFFSRNLKSISSAVEIYGITAGIASKFFSDIDHDSVNRLETAIGAVSDNNDIKAGTDHEIDRIRSALMKLDGSIKTFEGSANTQYRQFLETCTVTLSGKDLMNVVEDGAKDLLDREIAGKYRGLIKEAVIGIKNELNLTSKEALLLESLFDMDIKTAIQANIDAVERLRQLMNTQLSLRRMEILRGTARILSDLEDTARRLVSEAMELDMWIAIGLFARKRETVIPKLHDGPGIEIIKGKNLFLKGNIEPVDYALGEMLLSAADNHYSPERVAILSGVNSGGKTTTLDLIAQTLVLSHMGFPVPAEQAAVGFIDEMYYFGKSRGTMNAGAFESTIKEFSVVINHKKMAILVDELESITEPGASARIISGILESLIENPYALGVFVSHLAENIIEYTSAAVRVDGIEAQGLDEELNLIVDRNPRYNYVAKSTPELILERLSLMAKGDKRGFYKLLLEKFK